MTKLTASDLSTPLTNTKQTSKKRVVDGDQSSEFAFDESQSFLDEEERRADETIPTVEDDSIMSKSKDAVLGHINSKGIIDVVVRGGIVQPPVFRMEYTTDEIGNLADQSESVVIENLWHLTCGIVFDSFATSESLNPNDPNKGKKSSSSSITPNLNTAGKEVTNSTRFLAYFALMRKTIENYPLRKDGAFILKHFYIDENDIPTWPPSFLEHWLKIQQDCRTNLAKWLSAKTTCPLTAEEKSEMQFEQQVRCYVGYMINKTAKEAMTFANHDVNKHWPIKFKSGMSPCGTLQVIVFYIRVIFVQCYFVIIYYFNFMLFCY